MFPRHVTRVAALVLLIAIALLASASAVRAENRAYDGSGNNLAHPTWGSAGSALMRLSPNGYGDGVSSLGGATRPNPRLISNTIVFQPTLMPNARQLSDWVWQWGQFLDHDYDLVDPASPTEPAPIPVPPGDPVFTFPSIPFNRSAYDPATGTDPGNPRRQLNTLTSWLDGSMIYGSSHATAASLRSFSGGRMLTTPHPSGDLLPEDGSGAYRAGDVRVNEQLGLTAIHTLMVREHNHWANHIAADNPTWGDEQIYQRARKIVGAEVQAITFNEWLPALLGQGNVPAYAGYDPNVEPTVANEFAAALFRVGHTMLSPTLLRLDDEGNPIPQGNIALRDAFFQPQRIRDEGGIAPLLHGLASQRMQEVDQHVVEDVRSFLFTIPTGGFDLAALNIQRGRDHGLADYNAVRVAYGLPAVSSFSEITSDPLLATLLQALYADVNDIDPWIGALSEDHLPGSSLGPLLTSAVLDQFLRARSGDRFWYAHDPEMVDLIGMMDGTTLADIIRRNTEITNIQDNVFVIPEPTMLAWMGMAGLLAMRVRTRAPARGRVITARSCTPSRPRRTESRTRPPM
jgi:hypothetical protein